MKLQNFANEVSVCNQTFFLSDLDKYEMQRNFFLKMLKALITENLYIAAKKTKQFESEQNCVKLTDLSNQSFSLTNIFVNSLES